LGQCEEEFDNYKRNQNRIFRGWNCLPVSRDSELSRRMHRTLDPGSLCPIGQLMLFGRGARRDYFFLHDDFDYFGADWILEEEKVT